MTEERVDARDVEGERFGAPLRDAAVDPRPDDYLPPTNAGKADPHGPLVVAPGIHGVGPAPIRPGAVSSDPAEQMAAETELAQSVLVDNEPATSVAVEFDADKNMGPLGLSDPGSVDAVETGDAADPDGETTSAPARSAVKADWVDYAVSQGASRDEAEGMTKDQLTDRYGG
jgi:hypothetical protein